MSVSGETPEPCNLSTSALVESLAPMYRIRRFEQRAHDLFLRGLVKGTTHLAAGQEAIAVGASLALRPDDYVLATYRGHHHALARGASMEAAMAELLGRSTGICGGKGGSMHITSAKHGMLGSYAIVGAHLPIACGAAWSARLRGSDQVTVAFFGDGATNIGTFHEALNLAQIWRLPVIFVCENNLYMEYTPIGAMTAVEHPAFDRASAYSMSARLIDGNDLEVVYGAVEAAVARARAGAGPTLIEALTYRHGGHSRADPATYRPAEEVAAWLERDPLIRLRESLIARGITPEAIEQIEQEQRDAVEAAVEAAIRSPEPEPSIAETQVYADGGSAWRT